MAQIDMYIDVVGKKEWQQFCGVGKGCNVNMGNILLNIHSVQIVV